MSSISFIIILFLGGDIEVTGNNKHQLGSTIADMFTLVCKKKKIVSLQALKASRVDLG